MASDPVTAEGDGAARAAARRHARRANRTGARPGDDRSGPPANSQDRRVVVAFVAEVGDQLRDDLVERPGSGRR